MDPVFARAYVAKIGDALIAADAPHAAAYRSADIVVLPTRNENFGMTIAEALAGYRRPSLAVAAE